MKNVLIVGNYGVGNYGDDLLMKSVVSQIERLGADYIVACPGEVENSVGIMPAGIRSFVGLKWLDFFKALKKCDVVVFGGGGLLNPEEKMSLYIWGQIIVMAKIFKKEIVMVGQSFSSIDSVVSFLLSMVDGVSVRDSYSYKLLKEQYEGDLVRVDDLAWYLSPIVGGTVSRKDSVGLNLRPYKFVSKANLKKLVNDLIVAIEKVVDFEEIIILPFGLEDSDFCMDVLGVGIKNKYKVRVADSKDMGEAINSCKIIVAERLHACIVALKSDIPLISLSYSSKVFSMMNDVGLKSLINLRKDTSFLNVDDIVRLSLSKQYKKPHPMLDEVLKDVLS